MDMIMFRYSLLLMVLPSQCQLGMQFAQAQALSEEQSAIKASGSAASQVVNNITIGDDNFPNRFTGWANAVSSTGVEQVTVMKNTISDCYSGIEIRKAIFTDAHDLTGTRRYK